MAFLLTDSVPIDRSGTNYRVTGADMVALVRAQMGTTELEAATITARDALSGLSAGDEVFVVDASADVAVGTGWAIYRRMANATWQLITSQSALVSVSVASNLAYVAGPTGGTVTNSNGTGFALPAANGTNAGLMLPAQFTKLGFLTITAATDLDAIRGASHAAVTLGGSASTNPLTLSGQVLGFSIGQLALAP